MRVLGRGWRRGRGGGGRQRGRCRSAASACGCGCGACRPPADEESELEIFFRDATNGHGHLSGRPVRDARARARRPVPPRLQPRPQSVLRLQLGVSLPRAVARATRSRRRSRRASGTQGAGSGRPAPDRRRRRESRSPGRSRPGSRRSRPAASIRRGRRLPRDPGGRPSILAGGALPFSLELARRRRTLDRHALQRPRVPAALGRAASGATAWCSRWPTTTRRFRRGSTGDSLTGTYRNVGNRGPRVIPFRAARGRWPVAHAPAALVGRWDATFLSDFGSSPRVFELRDGPQGLEGTMISNTGDYGHFAGQRRGRQLHPGALRRLVRLHADRRAHGDTLRGVFHAGLRTPDAVDRRPEHGGGPPQDRPPRSPAPTPARRSGSPSPISRDGW